MVEYIYPNKNYKKLLLTDNDTVTTSKTSTDFIPKYISGINHPEFSRYLLPENRKYTIVKRLKTEESYLYKLLEGEEINIDWAAYNSRVVVPTLRSATAKDNIV